MFNATIIYASLPQAISAFAPLACGFIVYLSYLWFAFAGTVSMKEHWLQ